MVKGIVFRANYAFAGSTDFTQTWSIAYEIVYSQCKGLEQEVDTLRSNLQWAKDDQAHLEGDVLSLIEVAALLEA
ncbi:hypothetical protein B296_00045793 [Ensete ventricosum]|uniref:Uncharacterized protein n=1 Tax=Ensete ventricosum TaxID=4639 RepID=A0A426YEV3_ENSVE|nr:hypothetical protein B296_00045793 [Ensete ventricosum]